MTTTKGRHWLGIDESKVNRRRFLKGGAATIGAGIGTFGMLRDNWVFDFKGNAAHAAAAEGEQKLVPTQCPYCGVGCHSYLVVQGGRIVAAVPDKDSTVNLGMQCIKGLTAAEAIYVDRFTKVLVRKDMSNPLTGHVSKTKGRFDDAVWRETTWEEASHLLIDMTIGIVKKFGGNAIGAYGSGQLTMEEQWLENQFMKGVLQSNTIEANARMCMTSAVTGYIAALGSDHPPGCYEDIETADMINFFGHNARGSHSVLYWRVVAEKEKRSIPTIVVDPRYTGTMDGLYQINPSNAYNVTIKPNGDISLVNAMAHVILKELPDAVDGQFVLSHTRGFEQYREGILARYSPEQVIDRTGLAPELVRKLATSWAEASMKGRASGKGGVVSFWGIGGWNQSIHGQHNVLSLINLHLLTGNVARTGAGPFSMTGQPNAMSERLMGGLTGRLPFNEGINNKPHRDHIAEAWGVPKERLAETAKRKNKGYAVGMMERGLKGGLKMLKYSYATHIDMPEVKSLLRPALTKMFVVATESYRHAPNLLYADIALPAATFGEKGGTYQNSERRIYITDKAVEPPANTKPDLDIIIDEGREVAKKLGLDADKVFPYKKATKGPHKGNYDPEDVFRVILAASKGTGTDISGLLELEKTDGVSPYDSLRETKGLFYPAPSYETAKAGGIKRKYGNQEGALWPDRPYGYFPHKDGRARFKLCEQDYSRAKEILAKVEKIGTDTKTMAVDHYNVLKEIRDNGLPPELPEFEALGLTLAEQQKGNAFPLWLSLGVVFEHFHTAKTIRSATTRRLVPEMYVEINPEDARRWGIKDGEWVRVVTPRIDAETKKNAFYEARASIGTNSKVRPARNRVMRGQIFSPWNLSVADSADQAKNRWLVNGVASRLFDPVSGQADFKHLKARIEKIA
ncbi:MAG: molybdopterin oxidoreductase family protein [Rhodospirillales bacterium]